MSDPIRCTHLSPDGSRPCHPCSHTLGWSKCYWKI